MDSKEYAATVSFLVEDFAINTQLYDDETYNEGKSQDFIRQLIRITGEYKGHEIKKVD